MAKAKYQGHARGRSFQQQDPGYAALEQMSKRDDEVIRNLRQNQSDIHQQGLQALSDLKDRQRTEERNVSDINMDDEIDTLRQRSLQQNRQTIDQRQAASYKKHQQQQKNIEKLGEFSKTIVTSLLEIKKKDLDATIDAGYNYYISKGIPSDERDSFLLQEIQKVKNPGKVIQEYAERLKKEGANPEEIEYVRKYDNSPDYGRLKAQSKTAGGNFGGWARKQLLGVGALTLEQTEAALQILEIEYLKINNLYNLNADFLGDMFDSMRLSRNTILKEARNSDATASSNATLRRHEEAFYGDPTAENMQLIINAKAMVSENGKYKYTKADGVKHLLKLYADERIVPDADAFETAFKSIKSTDQNSLLWKRFESEWNNAILDRSTKSNAYAKLKSDERIRQGKEAENAAIEFLQSGKWDQQQGSLDQIEDNVQTAGGNTDVIKAYKHFTSQGQKKSEWERIFAEKGNSLGREDLLDPNIPYELISKDSKWGKIADANDKRRQGGKTDAELRKVFKGVLELKIGDLSTTTKVHYSADFAATGAIQLYNDTLAEREEANASNPHKDAFDYVIAAINKPEEYGNVFAVSNSSADDNPFRKQSIFTKFAFVNQDRSQADHQYELAYNNPVTLDRTYQKLIENRNAINEILFLNPTYLDIQAKRIGQGLPYEAPAFVRNLSLIQKIPVHEIMQAQLKLGGHDVDLGKDFRNELSKDVTDKALQDAIKRIRTVGGLENLMKLKVNPRDPEGMTPKIRTYHRNFNDNAYTRQPRTNLSWNLLVDASEGQVSEADAEFADDNGILLKDNSRVWMLENLQDFDFYYSFEKGAMGSFKVGGT